MSDDIRDIRLQKAEALKERGIDPWAKSSGPVTSISEVIEGVSDVDDGDLGEEQFETAGRITAIREHGKAAFLDLQEETETVQVYLKEDRIGEDLFEVYEEFLDIGDWIRVKGEGGKTRTGEPTIFARSYDILTKSLRPLPEKWHGLKDVDIRFRKRYLDLIANDEVMETFRDRSRILRETRAFLQERSYREVETPMMHPVAGGAAATPFVTYHETLDMDLFLRIAPELYLKRLLVGGMPRIFEINRNFRNEGISPRHNPEFTMLELYEAHGNYETTMKLTEQLLSYLADTITGDTTVSYDGKDLDFSVPFRRATYRELFEKHVGIDPDDREAVEQRSKETGIFDEERPPAKQANELFEEFVEPELEGPVFVIDYPVEISPFARRSEDNPDVSERFELFIHNMEVANSFTELTDPLDQRERLVEQMEQREEGYHELDEDFLTALEHGMPPAGGLGIGIDRLVMLLTDSDSIREVILFPQMRPREQE